VNVEFDESRARLSVRGVELFNDHDVANSLTYGLGLPGDLGFPYPRINPVQPVRASVSFEIEWSGLLGAAEIRNTTQGFEGSFLKTGATIKWSSEEARLPVPVGGAKPFAQAVRCPWAGTKRRVFHVGFRRLAGQREAGAVTKLPAIGRNVVETRWSYGARDRARGRRWTTGVTCITSLKLRY